MREHEQARAARLPTPIRGLRVSLWIARAIERRRQVRQERLELIERLGREERRALQSGERVREPRWNLLRR